MSRETTKDIFEPEIPMVPDGWEVLPFNQAAKVISDQGKRLKQKQYLEKGEIPVIDQGQDYIGGYTNDKKMAFEGELPVILFGDHTRSLKYVDKLFAVGAEGIKIIKPDESYDPKFFYYLLRSLHIPSRGYSRHFQFLKKFHFPLAPEAQQKRIVAEIEKQFSRLDEAVANLKRVKANLKRYKAAVLKAAVEGKLTEEWRKEHLPAPMSRPGKFYTYAILCDDDSIYIGHTSDIERRWQEHLEGKGSEWTKEHKPVKIAHYEEFDSREEAAKREKNLKTGYGRKWIKRELAVGRTRQAGRIEPASKLLERILAERRQKWEEAELAKMKAKGLPAPKNDVWWLYVLLCDDKSFYIGVTNDLPRRWAEHSTGKGAEWTKKHKPLQIVHHEKFKSQEEAYNREKELKTGYGRKWLKREYEKGNLRQAGKIPKDDKWKKKYKEPELVAVNDVIDLPESWCWATNETISFVTKLAGFEYTKFVKYDDAGNLAVLKAENAGRDGFKRTEFSKVKSETVSQLTRSQLIPGDLLMVFVGAGTGNVARVPDDQPYFLGPNIGMIRVESQFILPEYLELFLRSPLGNSLALGFAKAVAQPSLSMGSIRKIPIAVPPLNEQKIVVAELERLLSNIDETGLVVEVNHKRAERLRQSILGQAFSGELSL